MNSANTSSHDEIVKQLEELTKGLFYVSESDYPLEVVVLGQVTDSMPVQASILAKTGQSSNNQVQEETLAYFLRNMTKERPTTDEEVKNRTARFRLLQQFMEQHLQDVKVYRIGNREVKAFAFGKTDNNHYAGFKTTVVET